MDSTTALTIVNSAIANLKDAYSSEIGYAVTTVIVVSVTFALIRWVFRSVRSG